MRKIILKLIDSIGEILLYFTALTCALMTMIIAKEATWWLITGLIISLMVYLFEHRRKNEVNNEK